MSAKGRERTVAQVFLSGVSSSVPLMSERAHATVSTMARRTSSYLKLLANIALAVTLAASFVMIVWSRVIGDRLDDLIERSVEARSTGDVSAFEGYRDSGYLLLQQSQDLQPWLLAAYFGVAFAVIAMLSRWMSRRRVRTA